jgi:2-iminobutanoate/2-iminopropanoate deaminase
MEIISTPSAPKPIGAYSQAVKSNGFIYVSGQLPIDMATGILSSEGVHKETKIILVNIANILAAGGSSLEKVVKFTVYLKEINDIKFINEVFQEVFGANAPARSTIQAARLPKDAKVEIEAIAEV